MKAILEFQLPEEKEAFELAQKASYMACQIEEIQRLIRSLDKYGGFGDVSLESLSKSEIVSFIRDEVGKILSSE